MQRYWNVPAHTLHVLPKSLPLKIAALIEPLSVACHDVGISDISPREWAVVLGGGPIGILVALVARYEKANVLLAEPNQKRRNIAESLDLMTINPAEDDMAKGVQEFTGGAMADVVFEVSGAQSAVGDMTGLLCSRGKIVLVGIHSQPRTVDLFQFFWRELRLFGARVYEPKDFEKAIVLADSRALPLEKLITQVSPLADIQQVFQTIDANPAGIKYLLDIQG
jgi:2-desacetyl-2-hydroxyethyl bacteriochlorophyllide A dehydrogenase